jgi:hypothetical protein
MLFQSPALESLFVHSSVSTDEYVPSDCDAQVINLITLSQIIGERYEYKE